MLIIDSPMHCLLTAFVNSDTFRDWKKVTAYIHEGLPIPENMLAEAIRYINGSPRSFMDDEEHEAAYKLLTTHNDKVKGAFMKTRGEMPAQAQTLTGYGEGEGVVSVMDRYGPEQAGLTIREELAARMAAGLLASASDSNGQWTHDGPKNVAREAVEMADALLAELAKGGEE